MMDGNNGDMSDSIRPDEDDLFTSAVQSPLTDSRNASPQPTMTPAAVTDDVTTVADVTAEISLEDDDDEVSEQQLGTSPPTVAEGREPPRLSLSDELAAQPPAAAAPAQNGASTQQLQRSMADRIEEMDEDQEQFVDIHVTEPVKIGDGMSSYMAYKVTTKTNVSFFKAQRFSVMRRFSDFLGLHDKLAAKHIRSGRIVPPAPEKSVIGTTKMKMTSSPSGGLSAPGGASADPSSSSAQNEFIERRRHALERYLNRTARHSTLRADPDLREFLELDQELPRATQTSALSSAGVLRLFNRVGETVSKIAFKMDESDGWFEERAQQVELLDGQLKKLHASVEALVLYRRDLAHSTGQLARAAAMLSNVEEHTALSRALSQLAELQERVQHLHNQQADHDFYLLAEMLKDYCMLLATVKDVFHEREKSFQTWQHAVQVLTKKRESRARQELQGRTDKLQLASEEVAEWVGKSERSQDEFERVSRSIKKEMESFDTTRIQDFKEAFIKHLDTLMSHQQKLVKLWELFLPEVKAIP